MSSGHDDQTTQSLPNPRTFVSSGFTTVDVMFDDSVDASPGGTATNVARALQTLGWSTKVVGTIGDDPTGRFVRDELRNDGVDVEFLRQDPAWTTPVIVQEATRGDHAWRFSCPVCGARFAKHRPTSATAAPTMAAEIGAPDVFFFDRVSLFTLELARAWATEGTFVVFEPAALGRPHLFERAIQIAHLVKYSKERAHEFRDRLELSPAVLVETLGSDGARYRSPGSREWQHVGAGTVSGIVDSAGAGDWTSAGLIDDLFTAPGDSGRLDFNRAVISGQRLGSLACTWKGVFPDALRTLDVEFEQFGCPKVIHEMSLQRDGGLTADGSTSGARRATPV